MRRIGSEKREKINPRQIHKSYMEKLESEMEEKGVVLLDTDNHLNINEDYLDLPREVTEVPSRDLGEYLNAYTQQKVYLRTVLCRCEMIVEECKREYFSSTEHHYKRFTVDKISETAKDRLLNALPDVKPKYETYMDAIRKKSMVEVTIANIEDIVFMLSREVTRRSSDLEDSRY